MISVEYMKIVPYNNSRHGGHNMNEIQTTAATTPVKVRSFDTLYTSFVSYLDAAPRTVETYSRALKQFFGFLQNEGISEPQRADVLAYKERLQEKYKPTTIQNYITAVKIFFNWTDQEGLYPNVAQHIKGAKLDHEFKKDYFNKNQLKDIGASMETDTLQGKRDYAIFRLMSSNGLRDIEVSRANVEDLRTRGENTVLYIQGKGHEEKSDYVILGAKTETALRDYLKARGEYKDGDPLFTSVSNHANGGRLTTRSISRTIKNTMKDAGYNSSRLTAHSLRHSAATNALLAGKGIEEVQQFMRHSNINTTMIYNHALEKDNNTCAKTLDELF